MKIINPLLGFINIVCLVAALLLFAVQAPSLGLWFYRHEFQKNGTYEAMGMSEEDLDHVARAVISYLGGKEDSIDHVRVTVNGKERLFFNQKELDHMADVQVLFEWGLTLRNAACAGFAVTLAYFIIMRLMGSRPFRALLRGWGFSTLGVLGLLGGAGAYVALDFKRAFTMFHEVLFTNDLWLLDPRTDLLINMLPNAFFQDIALCIAAAFCGALALTAALSLLASRRFRRP